MSAAQDLAQDSELAPEGKVVVREVTTMADGRRETFYCWGQPGQEACPDE